MADKEWKPWWEKVGDFDTFHEKTCFSKKLIKGLKIVKKTAFFIFHLMTFFSTNNATTYKLCTLSHLFATTERKNEY